MDNTRYIDLKNFEILESPNGYIPCDKEIVDIVAILNKKGYETKASCAGHNEIFYDMQDEPRDIKELDRVKNDSCFKISKITEDKVWVKSEIVGGSTYIWFKENYNFDNLPADFSYKDGLLFKLVNYYNEKVAIRKDDCDLQKELENNWKALREWAINLKYNKNI